MYSQDYTDIAFYIENKEVLFWIFAKDSLKTTVVFKNSKDSLVLTGENAVLLYKHLLNRFPIQPPAVTPLPSHYFKQEAKKKRSAKLKPTNKKLI